MMRDDFDLADQRLSRLSRVAVLVATVGVAVITVWVFVPILLANHTTPTVAAAPKVRLVAPEPVAAPPVTGSIATVRSPPSRSVDAAPPSAVEAASAAPLAVADASAAAQQDESVAPAPAALAAASPSSGGPSIAAAAVPWPIAPSPVPPAPGMQLASAPADTPGDELEIVPLPRSRPSRMIAARLTIPLPRPRPPIASDGPTAEQTLFERQVERMR